MMDHTLEYGSFYILKVDQLIFLYSSSGIRIYKIQEQVSVYREVAGLISIILPIISMTYMETARSLFFLGLQAGSRSTPLA